MNNRPRIEELIAEFKTHNGRGSLLRANATLVEIITLLMDAIDGKETPPKPIEDTFDVRLDEVVRNWNIPVETPNVEPEAPKELDPVVDAMLDIIAKPASDVFGTPVEPIDVPPIAAPVDAPAAASTLVETKAKRTPAKRVSKPAKSATKTPKKGV